MSTISLVMMIVAMVTVWGGLVLALINIKRSPEFPDELDTPAPGRAQEAQDVSAAPPQAPAERV